MAIEFEPCEVPWNTGAWGVSLRHSDTDVCPECSVEFSGLTIPELEGPATRWISVEFADATFVRASPHRDDEDLRDVTGYTIAGRERDYDEQRAEWLRTGICPDPYFYFCTDSPWLDQCRAAWSNRNRSRPTEDEAVHFLLDGRDGYVEIMASAFIWSAWYEGRPRLDDVDRSNPIATGGTSWRRSPSSLRRIDGKPN